MATTLHEKLLGSSNRAMRVYFALHAAAGDNRTIILSRRQLSEMCNVSRMTVTQAVAELERDGLIRVERRFSPNGGLAENVYTLI